MKRKILLSIIVFCLAVITFGAINTSAEAAEYGDFYYQIENGKACITGYSGSTNNLTIPGKINGYPVVIGERAFSGDKNLFYVTISEGVESIGEEAFYYSGVVDLTIPKTVKHMGSFAFGWCDRLVTVRITDLAAWCGIDFEDDVANPLFYATHLVVNGEYITDIVIPEGVERIGKYAFNGFNEPIPLDECRTVTIPKSVKYIGRDAFYGVEDLQKVYIKDIAAWCRIEFENENANPFSSGKELYLNGSRVWKITIPEEITSIGNYVFYNVEDLGTITLHDGITSIGTKAFYGTGLGSIEIPAAVTSIGENAFGGCTGITSLIIPDSVTSIGDEAFRDCSGLETLEVYGN